MRTGAWQQGAGRLAPALDDRDLDALVAQMKAMVPHYTPEWRFSPEDPDAGSALFFLAAQMLGDNVKRLNQAPLNNFIAFLDLLRVKLQPARPARASVTFKLNEGVREPVYVPGGTQLTAAVDDGGEDVPFETETALLVTPAKLTELFNVHPERDAIVHAATDYETGLAAGTVGELPLFDVDGTNMQEHAFYIRHDELFWMDRPAIVTLKVHNADKQYLENDVAALLARESVFEWSYFGKSGQWVPFEKATAYGSELALRKQSAGAALLTAVNGTEGRWIRCRLRPELDAERKLEALRAMPPMDRILMHAVHDRKTDPGGIRPTDLYFNDMELDKAGYYPFGEHFMPYSVFYIGCAEAFTKRGSRLKLSFKAKSVPNGLRMGPDPEIRWRMVMRKADFDKKPPQRLFIRKTIWEYWNGEGWMKLPESGKYEELFVGVPEAGAGYELDFPCPEDLSATYVNGREDRWIRVRVLQTDPVTDPLVEYMSPFLEDTSFTYRYAGDVRLSPDGAQAFNNADWRDVGTMVRQVGQTFKPFEPIPCPAPAVYFGFDMAPVKGPIRIHFTLGRRQPPDGDPPWVEWEAYVRSTSGQWGWETLRTSDGTSGFTDSGELQFVGPPNMAPASLFGLERAWLRAVNRDGRYGAPGASLPGVDAIRRNSVTAVQQLSIRQEYPEPRGDGYVLSSTPVIGQDIWVDETGSVDEHELNRLLEEHPDRFEAHRDSDGQIQRLWALWQEVPALTTSGTHDRHYTIDAASGVIAFGDGARGMTPPLVGGDKIRANYRVTEGARGNVAAGELNGIMGAIAFVERVVNAAAATGGGNAEPLERALVRGPQALKHRGRAVSAADAEWIVRELEPGIDKVKCLPNRDAKLRSRPGSVAIVALPPGGTDGASRFAGTRKRLARELLARVPNLLTAGGRLHVMAPAYLEISVVATISVESPEDVMPAEAACTEVLNRYLDTQAGQLDGQGWSIGEYAHPSAFYGLLQGVRGVRRVELLHLSVMRIENGTQVEMASDDMKSVLHGIVTGGKHRVTVVLGS
ncbi:baseplate J/gp47 family protein [Cohnella sp. GCM10027633]|uniref:baseplate J/gp47 family protein n=1 Tax=unclassified Cohnella TaxID=2636738 RepID=UPI003631227D